jgi:broad specificity phosphatase PhoE
MIDVTALQHRYVVLRHGESIPNERKIVCASMANGVKPEYGLSPLGRQQATAAGHSLAAGLRPFLSTAAWRGTPGSREPRGVHFVVSPFSRAQETAALAVAAMGLDAAAVVTTHDDLRERCFGALELQPDTSYGTVWAEDEAGAEASCVGAEHVRDVWARVQGVVAAAEQRFAAPTVVVLVAHGDTLQIAEAGFRGRRLGEHRALPHLSQAQWRDLQEPFRSA